MKPKERFLIALNRGIPDGFLSSNFFLARNYRKNSLVIELNFTMVQQLLNALLNLG